MALNNTADVYVITDEGVHLHVGKSINKQNLMLLSIPAGNAFKPPQSPDKHLFLLHEYMPGAPSVEPEAAKVVCKWIDSYDPNKSAESQVLSLDHLPSGPGGPTLQEVVHLYHTGYAFKLDPKRRGNVLRDEIIRYIHNGPLTENEFRMLHDLLPFDNGLLVSAQHSTMYAQAHGIEPPQDKSQKRVNKVVQDKDGVWHVYSRPDSEEFGKIVAFAKDRGIWEPMKDASRNIVLQKENSTLGALEFQMREARRLRNRHELTALGPKVAAQKTLIARLKDEGATIKAEREAVTKAQTEVVRMAEQAAKKSAEHEEARKAKQKPQ